MDEDRKGADPYAVVADPMLVRHLTAGKSRNGMAGTADHLPTVYRDGAMDHLKYPSRIGDRLTFPNGATEKA